jgi:hypothetical protein
MSKNKCFCDQLVSGFPFIRDIAIGTTTGTRVVECTYSPMRKVYEERGRPKRRRIRFLRIAVPVAVPPRCPGWVVIRKRKVNVLTRFTIHWWRFRHIGPVDGRRTGSQSIPISGLKSGLSDSVSQPTYQAGENPSAHATIVSRRRTTVRADADWTRSPTGLRGHNYSSRT